MSRKGAAFLLSLVLIGGVFSLVFKQGFINGTDTDLAMILTGHSASAAEPAKESATQPDVQPQPQPPVPIVASERDHLAALIIGAAVADPPENLVEWAYAQADKMLEARDVIVTPPDVEQEPPEPEPEDPPAEQPEEPENAPEEEPTGEAE